MEELLTFLHGLRDGRQLQPTPARAVDFHVEFIPACIGFVLPMFLFEFLDDRMNEADALHPGMTPVLDFIERFAAIDVSNRSNATECLGRRRVDAQSSFVTCPSARNGLKETEERNQRA